MTLEISHCTTPLWNINLFIKNNKNTLKIQNFRTEWCNFYKQIKKKQIPLFYEILIFLIDWFTVQYYNDENLWLLLQLMKQSALALHFRVYQNIMIQQDDVT